MAPRIRLVYSTIAMYASILVRVGTGLAFTFILARRLPLEDFAAFGVLVALSLFYGQLASIWSFWAARAAGRRMPDAAERVSSGILGVALLACAGFPVLAAASIVEYRLLGWDPLTLMAGYPYLAVMTLQYYLRDVVTAVAPEVFAKARIASELARLSAASLLVWTLRLGYTGALLSVIAASSTAALIMASRLAREGLLSKKPSPRIALEMARYWRVPLPQSLADSSPQLVRPVASWASGSSLVVAYLNVALTGQASLVQAALSTSLPLYGRLLSGGERRDARVSLALYMLFAGTFSAALLASSRSLARFYNPDYAGAWLALDAVVAYGLALGVVSIYRSVILALDTSDSTPHSTPSRLMSWVTRSQLSAAAAAYTIGAPLAYLLRGEPSLAAAAIPGALAASYTLLAVSLHSRVPGEGRLQPLDLAALSTGLGLAAALGYLHSGAGLWDVAFSALAGAIVYLTVVLALVADARVMAVRIARRLLGLS